MDTSLAHRIYAALDDEAWATASELAPKLFRCFHKQDVERVFIALKEMVRKGLAETTSEPVWKDGRLVNRIRWRRHTLRLPKGGERSRAGISRGA